MTPIEALERIASDGCEASLWAGEIPPVWDRCLNYDYTEAPPKARCNACLAHWTLFRLDTARNFRKMAVSNIATGQLQETNISRGFEVSVTDPTEESASDADDWFGGAEKPHEKAFAEALVLLQALVGEHGHESAYHIGCHACVARGHGPDHRRRRTHARLSRRGFRSLRQVADRVSVY